MKVDQKTVERIAHLARIRISPEEARELEGELSRILDWVRQLDELDTSNVPPMTRVAAMSAKMREDRVTEGGIAAQIVKNAPQAEDNFFVVPKAVE